MFTVCSEVYYIFSEVLSYLLLFEKKKWLMGRLRVEIECASFHQGRLQHQGAAGFCGAARVR